MAKKQWYLSKTLWFNAISITLLGVEAYAQVYVLNPQLHLFLTALGNAILRFMTQQPITPSLPEAIGKAIKE